MILLLTNCNSNENSVNSESASNPSSTSHSIPPKTNSDTNKVSKIKFKDVSSGPFTVCGISMDDKILCWGQNLYGSLGREGFEQYSSSTPEITSYFKNKVLKPTSLSVGDGHNCFVDGLSNKPYCWGISAKGSSSTGLHSSFEPQEILLNDQSIFAKATSVSSGNDVCSITLDKKLYCWKRGQFYDGELKHPAQAVMSEGAPLSNIVQISATGRTKCAVTSEGYAYCWGNGVYPLGTRKKSSQPLKVLDPQGEQYLSNVASISTNDGRTICAVTFNGSLYCWGGNHGGQIGNGTNEGTDFPVRVIGQNRSGFLENVKQVSVGESVACAVTKDGKAYCWGNNIAWSLGDGTQLNSFSPKRVKTSSSSYLENVQKIVVGTQHTCAIDIAGDIYCWGMNSSGQLGQRNVTYTPVPYATKVEAH